ncbi:hypothetical protein EV191_103227 [Tamaricihabitans halophyticus]|uniref:Uncharacterized protein n=1 Tax=Tamaricihabitans halophyticus TaxID=1262583 RepID=A0A4R2QXU0_9PSEU|nr:hypothetical protein [Tamaricihabitans halophyticus]TCP54184.1 hypothetical protein EV191_103227 [Tamaricihabitans halophyticus]
MSKRSSGMVQTLLAGVATATLLVGGATAASATDAEQARVGPSGYKDLTLNMPEEQAMATGLLTDRQVADDCRFYYLQPSEGKPNPGGGVFVSAKEGVVMIGGTDQIQTSEGVGFGDSIDEVRAAYPDLTSIGDPEWIYTAAAPGNPNAHYRFAFSDAGFVTDYGLNANEMGGCGS